MVLDTSLFYLLPNELVDEILLYVFKDVAAQDLSMTNSTYQEFAIYFDTKAFQNIDIQKVKLVLYKDMLIDLAYGFCGVSRQLESNMKYVLRQVLKKDEKKVKEREKIVDGILKVVRRRLRVAARKRLRVLS
jgi:hypothetical protein